MNNAITRTSKLISQKYMQLVVPNSLSAVTKALLLIVDSFLAAKFIGVSAMATVSLATPFLALDEMLHCFLGMGMSAEMSQAIGKGDRKRAHRILAAVLIAVVIIYILVFLPTVLFPRTVLGLFSSDIQLIEASVMYLVPLVIAMPFFEVMLCLERAYQIDGRPVLFATRPVVFTVVNIFLDIYFVTFLHMGVFGLALASILATLIGYCVTLSHGFSKKCTIHSDFSVLRIPGECLQYLKANIIRGGSAAIDQGLYSVVSAVMCKVLSVCGGVQALAILNIFFVLKNFVNAFMLGLNNSTALLGNVMFGKEDYTALKFVIKKGLKIAFIIGVSASIAYFCCIDTIGKLYGLEGEMLTSCVTVIKIISPLFLLFPLVSYLDACFLIINKFSYAYLFKISEEILALLFIIIGGSFGLYGVFIGNCLVYPILLAAIGFVYFKEKRLSFGCDDAVLIAEYSMQLKPTMITNISLELQNIISSRKIGSKLAYNISLLIEESCNLIMQKNEKKSVCADIQVYLKNGRLIICIMDNGIVFNSFFEIQSKNDIDYFEKKIITGLSDETNYNRVLELNFVVLKIDSRAM